MMRRLSPSHNWSARAFAGEVANHCGVPLHRGLHAAVMDATGRPVAVCGPLHAAECVEHATAISATYDLLNAAEAALQVLKRDDAAHAHRRVIDGLQAAIAKARSTPGAPLVAEQAPAPYSPATGAAARTEAQEPQDLGAMTAAELWHCLTQADARRDNRDLPLGVRMHALETRAQCLSMARVRGMGYDELRLAADRELAAAATQGVAHGG
jgi:hypothetical protein